MARNLTIKYEDGNWVDEIGRNIIVDRLTKSMYVVAKSGNKRYNIMRGRLAFVAALTMAACAFINLPVGVIVFIVSFIVAELVYRLNYLPSLQKITGQELPTKPTLLEKYKMDNDGTLILMLLLSVALIVILPLYIKQEVNDINLAFKFKDLNGAIIVYGSIIFSILAIYLIYNITATLIRRHKK